MQYIVNYESSAPLFLLQTFLHFVQIQPANAKLLHYKRLKHIFLPFNKLLAYFQWLVLQVLFLFDVLFIYKTCYVDCVKLI